MSDKLCSGCDTQVRRQRKTCECGSTNFTELDGSELKVKKTSSTKSSIRKTDVEKIVRLVLEVQKSEEVSEPEKKKPTVDDYRKSTTQKEKKELDDLCSEWEKWESLSSNDPEKKKLVKIIQSVLNQSEE